MGSEGPFQVRQDLVDAEYGSGHAGLGPTGAQVAFDLLFGLAAPIALMLADPALFTADVADRAALPPYLAQPVQVLLAGLLVALCVWGITGMRVPLLGMLLAGPFAAGALLFAFFGLKLLWFALAHADLLSGWLAFTPWCTAFVFARHCALACRAGARRSLGLTIPALVVTCAAIVGTLLAIRTARERRARALEGMLLGENPADFEYACSQIRTASDVDMDRVAEQYATLKEDDPRRTRLRNAYQRITRGPVEAALRRLFPRVYAADAHAPKAAPKEKDDQTTKLIKLLFSDDFQEHDKAADELTNHTPDPRVLEAIVARYVRLPASDGRRAWIERAYRHISSGEPIEQAVSRLKRKPTPPEGQPRAPAKAPKAPAPRRPAPKTAQETP